MRSVSAVRTSNAENGSSISSNFGIDHKRPCEAHALPHAAGQFLRIGGFEPVEADEVDGGKRAFAPFLRENALRFEPKFHILKHRKPGKKREALENHG